MEEVDVSKCSNLAMRKPASINTRGNCARLYKEANCTGDTIEVMPNSPSHYKLEQWDFHEETKSVGPCRDPCSFEITGGVPASPHHVSIFDQPAFKGLQTPLGS